MAMLEHLSAVFSAPESRSALISILLAGALVLYAAVLALWRLYLSPLAKAKIPGPKLAALTQWYETYFDVFKNGGGQFLFQYLKLHEEYGPIVRISPSEVHIRDTEYYEEFYRKPYDKLERLKYRFNNSEATFSTTHHGLHRMRRAALNPFFSPRKVAQQAPIIQGHIDRLCSRIANEYSGKERVLVLNDAFGCLSSDTVVEYCFERSYHFIDAPDFKSTFPKAVKDLQKGVHVVTQFPWLSTLFRTLPDSVVGFLQPQMKSVIDFNNKMRSQIIGILNSRFDADEKQTSHDNVFNAILQSDLPPEQLSELRLQHEAISVVGAGLETINTVLTLACFHIYNNPTIFDRLRAELNTAIPDITNPPSLAELQRLPYLSACIEEALRLSYGITQRTPRVSRTQTTHYGGYVLPPNTEISMSIYSITHDEKVFPNSRTYNPSRWLGNPKGPDGQKLLSRYMMSFGKGHRICVGMHLAYGEISMGLAAVVRRFRFKLWETTNADVECWSDFLAARPKPGSKGVRVLVE